MRTWRAMLALGALTIAVSAQAVGQLTIYYVDFPKGYEGRTYTRSIKGNDLYDYLVRNVEADQKHAILHKFWPNHVGQR